MVKVYQSSNIGGENGTTTPTGSDIDLHWAFQDFSAGEIIGTVINISKNDNGIDAFFNANAIIQSSYFITRADNVNAYVHSTALGLGFLSVVKIKNAIGTSITLNKTPHSSYPVRVHYKIKTDTNLPSSYTEPPKAVSVAFADGLKEIFATKKENEEAKLRSNHTGEQSVATLSDFEPQVMAKIHTQTINSLTSDSTNQPLAAIQGKELKNLIDSKQDKEEGKGLIQTVKIDKLDAIEDGATADQNGDEIVGLIEQVADHNLITDALLNKIIALPIDSGQKITNNELAITSLNSSKADHTELSNAIDNLKGNVDATGDTLAKLKDLIDAKVSQVNGHTGDVIIKEEDIYSSVIEPTIIAGAYTFDINLGRSFYITLTQDTSLTMPSLANSQSVVFTAQITGDYALTFTNANKVPNTNDYVGVQANEVVFRCVKLANGTQINKFTVNNLG